MACRFPGSASSVEKFWDMIINGRTGHSPIPPDRFNADAWYHPSHERRGTIQPRSGFFLEESPSVFDAPFFSLTAKEAAGMDPMQRKVLEIAYEAFENAGIPMGTLRGTATAVYTGVMTNDYELITAGDPLQLPQNAAAGTSRAMLSNRISWFFDLRGPSFTLDTACSSSLYALHLACQSLRLGESTQALVTGVNMILSPSFVSQLSSMHMLSPDGKSHSFDARANGYARGEALGAVVVKTLRQALADGDTIRAVIRGTGANQDGKTTGITMPSGEAQESLILSTYVAAGLDLKDTEYFEAHGTGTSLGDPIELGAIGASLGIHRSPETPLVVGSVKTNIGHTEGAAGIAGVIKAVLALERGVIPPLGEFETLNPKLRLEEWNLVLPLKPRAWSTPGQRRASVNSFGFGGANAHVILDDAYNYLCSRGLHGNHWTVYDKDDLSDSGLSVSGKSDVEEDKTPKLFVFSSFDRAGIQRIGSSFADFLSNNDSRQDHKDLAYTLACRRTHFDFRSFAVAASLPVLAAKLTEGLPKFARVSRQQNVIFVFTGQGAQWPAMGRELLSNPVFCDSIDRSQAALDQVGCAWQVKPLLTNPDDRRIDAPEFSQPVCTIVQIALVDLLKSWGVKPRSTVGHSSGEVAAAYAAEHISQDDAVRIGYWRGFYSEEIKHRVRDRRGGMMAAGVSETEALEYLKEVPEGSAVVGCVNSPSSVTLSGDLESINRLEAILKENGKFARKLRVQVAYHSPHMQAVADDFLHALGDVQTRPSSILMFSSVTEQLVDDHKLLGSSYWMRNLLSPVRFSGALTALLGHTTAGRTRRRKAPISWSALVEIGPHEALKGPCRQILGAWDNKAPERILYTSVLSRGKHAQETALTAAGLLWTSGHPVRLQRINETKFETSKHLVLPDLPSYAWNHDKGFWHEPPAARSARLRTQPRTDLLGIPVPNQNPLEPCWRNVFRLAECPWLQDHIITGAILYPGAGLLIMALEAARQMADPDRQLQGVEFHEVHFDKGLVIPSGDQGVETVLSVRPHETLKNRYQYTVFSLTEDAGWMKHSWGQFMLHYVQSDGSGSDAASDPLAAEWQGYTDSYQDLQCRASREIEISSFYDQLQLIGTEYGPTFRNLVEAAVVEGEHHGIGSIRVPDTRSTMPHQYEYPHLIHPATLDAIFHLIFVAMGEGNPLQESAIPRLVERLYVSARQPSGVGAKYSGFARSVILSGRDTLGEIVVWDGSRSEPKVVVQGMVVTEVSSGASGHSRPLLSSGGHKCVGKLSWKEDIDSLIGNTAKTFFESKFTEFQDGDVSRAGAQLGAWLDRATFKHADLNTLVLSPADCPDIIELLKRFAPKSDERLRFRKCTVVENAAEDAMEKSVQQQLAEAKLDVTFATLDHALNSLGPYDLILAPGTNLELVSQLAPVLGPEGRIALVTSSQQHAASQTIWAESLTASGIGHIVALTEHEGSSLLIASADVEPQLEVDSSEIVILQRPEPGPAAISLEEQLSQRFAVQGRQVRRAIPCDVDQLAGKVVISLLEAEAPWVVSWTAEEFEQFRKLTAARYLLWITKGGILAAEEASLDYAPTTGLLRTVRVEKPQILLPHLDLSPVLNLGSGQAADLIQTVFHLTTKVRVRGKNNEMEFAESNNILWIPRVEAHDTLDNELALQSSSVLSVPEKLYQAALPRVLEAVRQGDITSLRWVPDTHESTALASGEVEVQPTHVALNPSDIQAFTRKGQTPTLGREVVGVVTRIGPHVSGLLPGDRVLTLHPAPFRTHLYAEQGSLLKVPCSLSSEEAVSLPLVLAHAWHVLIDIAQFRAGQSIWVDAATGSFGQALIQLVKLIGGSLLVSIRSPEDRAWVSKTYDIPVDRIFDGNPVSWPSRIRAVTSGKGLDVIVNSSGGAVVNSLSGSVADGGHFVDVSRQVHSSMLASGIFQRNIRLSFLDLDCLSDQTVRNLVERNLPLIETGCIGRIHPIMTYPVSELTTAIAEVQNGHNSGRIVVEFNRDAEVPVLPSPPPVLALDPTGTYILSGGLGALGLSVAENMCAHGARHLVFLSRSGVSTIRQRQALQSLQDHGCAVDIIRCDVTDASQVARVAQVFEEKKWQVKGILQLAMVLRDSIFDNMTYEKWRTAVDPKVKGTWNLHSLLPQELDFFIILSSISGIIGNSGQANYCAGNTYEDAVAHYRHSRGLAATTLNVGLVTDASRFNESSTVEDFLRKYSHLASAQLTDRELQNALTAVMRGRLSDGQPVPSQLLVGISDNVRREGEGLNLWPRDRKFDHRVNQTDQCGATKEEYSNSQKLQGAETVSDAVSVVEEALRLNVANALAASPSDIDTDKPFYSFGIDSLKAIEVRNWVFNELQTDVSVFEILSPIPLSRLAMKIVAKSSLVLPEVAKQAAAESDE
ncbi:hypothetical protein VTN02DRAFT_5830 [Thermoascus thermophilus]